MKLSRILTLFIVLCLLSSCALARTPEDAEKTVALIQKYPLFDAEYKENIELRDEGIIAVYSGFMYGTGTGFAVGDSKDNVEYFVTNHHVVDPGKTTMVYYDYYDAYTGNPVVNEEGRQQFGMLEVPVTGAEYYVVFESEATRVPAKLVATSDRADLAVLRLETPSNKREASILRPYDTLPKQDVYPLGFPGVAEDLMPTDDAGKQHVQSTKGRINSFYSHEESHEGDMFFMDAPINHGNSGGPVVDAAGCVVGVSVSGHPDYPNLNCAISVNEVVRMLESSSIPYITAAQARIPAPGEANMLLLFAIAAGVAVIIVLLFVLIRRSRKNSGADDHKKTDSDADKHKKTDSDQDSDIEIIDPVTPDRVKPDASRALVGKTGAMAGRNFPLGASTVIGRDPSCTIAYPDQAGGISGRHCSIKCEGGVVSVTDLGSKYGTWIDDVRLTPGQPMVMHRGHTLYLGSKEQALTLHSGHGASGGHQPSPAAQKRTLVCTAGTFSGRCFDLHARTVIGRDPSCTIAFPDRTPGISGRHCTVEFAGGVVTVTDPGSSYGTWIDDQKLIPGQPMVMHRGHTLYLGSKEQAFELHS